MALGIQRNSEVGGLYDHSRAKSIGFDVKSNRAGNLGVGTKQVGYGHAKWLDKRKKFTYLDLAIFLLLHEVR